MDRWKTLPVRCEGGLNVNEDPLAYTPGEAKSLVNFEASIYGGYRRVNGYTQYDATEVPGTGKVLGVCVATFNSTNYGVIACRENDVYYNTGSGWGSPINTPARAGATKYRFERYAMSGEQRVLMCDGVNPAARYNGTTYTLINGAGAPADPKFACEFKNVVFYGGYSANINAVTFSSPNTDDDFDAANGAAEINMGDTVTGIKVFRDSLIVFCRNSIYKITGDTVFNFDIQPITRNLGCIATDTIQEINTDIVFLSPDGVRTIAGTTNIGDTELGNLSKKIQPIIYDILPLVVDQDLISSAIIRGKSQYRLLYTTSSTLDQDSRGVIGVYTSHKPNAASGNISYSSTTAPSWEWSELLGIRASCLDSGELNTLETIVHGGFDGYVYQQEFGNTFGDNPINASLKTAPLFFDDPEMRKTLYKLTTFIRAEGTYTINARALFDYEQTGVSQPNAVSVMQGDGIVSFGSAVFDTDVFGGSRNPRYTNNLIGSGRVIQFTFTSSAADDAPYTIQSFTVQYGLEGRR